MVGRRGGPSLQGPPIDIRLDCWWASKTRPTLHGISIMAMKNLKNIDFKTFFIQKGEKIGLWVCVGIMALLVVLTMMSIIGGPSAGANAEKLTDLGKNGKQKIDSAQPGPDLAQLDPQIKKAET